VKGGNWGRGTGGRFEERGKACWRVASLGSHVIDLAMARHSSSKTPVTPLMRTKPNSRCILVLQTCFYFGQGIAQSIDKQGDVFANPSKWISTGPVLLEIHKIPGKDPRWVGKFGFWRPFSENVGNLMFVTSVIDLKRHEFILVVLKSHYSETKCSFSSEEYLAKH